MKTVRNCPGLSGKQFGQTRVVGAEDQGFPGLPTKVGKLATNRFEVGVEVEMLFVHVQDDGMMGPKLGEGAVTFVRFGDKVWREMARAVRR